MVVVGPAGCSLLSSKESSKEALPAANYLFVTSLLLGAVPPSPQTSM